MITADDLTLIPEFEDLELEDREWLASRFEERQFQIGERPFEPGSPADHLMIVLAGEMRIFVQRKNEWRFFANLESGTVTGLLPYSRMKTYEGRSDVIAPLRIGLLHKDLFPDVLYRLPILGQRLVAKMSDRVRNVMRVDQERDKMMALGKLSAGLAHELNNPAAAARRAAADLDSLLKELPNTVARLVGYGLTPESVIPAAEACTLPHAKKPLTALELADREDELLDWLEDHEVDEAWQLAPALSESGVTVEKLESATEGLPQEAIHDVVQWIQQSTSASRLIGEVHAASERISELVGSVKSYSHMDRSNEKQPVDVRPGLESTVTMLGHKMKQKAISVDQVWPDELPLVAGYPGELNQVWTNIIDNAIDALPDEGTIRIVASDFGPHVEVCIEDNGGGIPEDVLPRIFEPFYSTKDVGQGTGLGLDIAHRIVVEQHRGQILVESQPGRTRFRVQIPKMAE